jgi:hypothetical protein
LGVKQTPSRRQSMSANDPGCVKTLCRCYDSPVILRGI